MTDTNAAAPAPPAKAAAVRRARKLERKRMERDGVK